MRAAPDPSEVLSLLRSAYGELAPPRQWDPLEELVLTILSQNTSDVNSGRAFESLREAFPDWEEVSGVPVEAVVQAIRAGGLANTKAPRIQEVLREIADRQDGSLDLSWMADASDDQVSGFLETLPGVGPKTVACVLAFSLGRDVIPVDTHVLRVATRLGWLAPGTGAEAAHHLLAEAMPEGARVSLHVGLIALGRDACRAQRPRCVDCVLGRICPSAGVD